MYRATKTPTQVLKVEGIFNGYKRGIMYFVVHKKIKSRPGSSERLSLPHIIQMIIVAMPSVLVYMSLLGATKEPLSYRSLYVSIIARC